MYCFIYFLCILGLLHVCILLRFAMQHLINHVKMMMMMLLIKSRIIHHWGQLSFLRHNSKNTGAMTSNFLSALTVHGTLGQHESACGFCGSVGGRDKYRVRKKWVTAGDSCPQSSSTHVICASLGL